METDWYDTSKWSRDANGYAICPCCGAMVHQRMVEIHAHACTAVEAQMKRQQEVTHG